MRCQSDRAPPYLHLANPFVFQRNEQSKERQTISRIQFDHPKQRSSPKGICGHLLINDIIIRLEPWRAVSRYIVFFALVFRKSVFSFEYLGAYIAFCIFVFLLRMLG
jgi:hypothetical protein